MNADEMQELIDNLRQDAFDWDEQYAQNFFAVTRRSKQAADLIESLQGQLAESQRRERAAAEDMNLIVNKISNCRVLIAGGTDRVSGLALGRCDVCKKICHEDKPCKFEWRGPQAGEVNHE